jgi:hypothetical protein
MQQYFWVRGTDRLSKATCTVSGTCFAMPDDWPPSRSWYTDRQVFELELATTFNSNWIPVGHIEQLKEPLSYISGVLCNRPFLVVRNKDAEVWVNALQ